MKYTFTENLKRNYTLISIFLELIQYTKSNIKYQTV